MSARLTISSRSEPAAALQTSMVETGAGEHTSIESGLTCREMQTCVLKGNLRPEKGQLGPAWNFTRYYAHNSAYYFSLLPEVSQSTSAPGQLDNMFPGHHIS